MRHAFEDMIRLLGRNPDPPAPERNRVCRTKTRMVVPLSLITFKLSKDAFLWLLQAADLSPIQFRGDCTWSSLGLIFTALLWSWSDEKTLQDRFSTRPPRKICFKALGKLALGQGADDEPAGSYQAFMKMLRIWTASLVLQLMVVFRERMHTTLPDRLTIAGFEVFAVDGSRLEVPRTKSNESRFSPRSAQKRRRGKGAKRRKPALRRDRTRSVPVPRRPTDPGMADGHVACGDRPALGLANRAIRQQ